MGLFDFSVALRSDLLGLIRTIHDAERNEWYWDTSKSNCDIRVELKELLKKYSSMAHEFGVFMVKEHNNCGQPNHGDEFNCILGDMYGSPVSFWDFFFTRRYLETNEQYEKCPCTPDGGYVMHRFRDLVYIDNRVNGNVTGYVYSLLCKLYYSIEAAGDKKPRSGVREKILKAIFEIHEYILPFSVDDYIAMKSNGLLP